MKSNSMNNTNSVDDYATLKKLNDEEVMRQVPLIVYLAILCISGFAGNSLICYIFAKKCKLSTFHNFVTALSIIDFFTCCTAIPLELISQFWQYTFDNIWLCKITAFLCTFTAFTSGSLLFCIAFDRYRKVCTPLRWQVSVRVARYACVASAAVGIATAWANPVVFGIQDRRHGVYNVTISQCVVTENCKDSSFMHLINIVLTSFFFVGLIGSCSFYGSIAWRVKKQMKWKCEKQAGVEIRGKKLEKTPVCNKTAAEQSEEAQGPKSDTTVSIDLLDSVSADKGRVLEPATLEIEENKHYVNETGVEQSEETQGPKSDTAVSTDVMGSVSATLEMKQNECHNNKTVVEQPEETQRSESDTAVNTGILDPVSANKGRVVEPATLKLKKDEHHNDKIQSSNFDLRKGSQRSRKNKMTLVMFMVLLAYIISFLPAIALFLIKTLDKTFVTSLNDFDRSVFKFFLKSYFLNNAINPVIYGIFDTWFRKSCKKLCTCRHGI